MRHLPTSLPFAKTIRIQIAVRLCVSTRQSTIHCQCPMWKLSRCRKAPSRRSRACSLTQASCPPMMSMRLRVNAVIVTFIAHACILSRFLHKYALQWDAMFKWIWLRKRLSFVLIVKCIGFPKCACRVCNDKTIQENLWLIKEFRVQWSHDQERVRRMASRRRQIVKKQMSPEQRNAPEQLKGEGIRKRPTASRSAHWWSSAMRAAH